MLIIVLSAQKAKIDLILRIIVNVWKDIIKSKGNQIVKIVILYVKIVKKIIMIIIAYLVIQIFNNNFNNHKSVPANKFLKMKIATNVIEMLALLVF